MGRRHPETQQEFAWWLQELEDSDALSDEALADRYLVVRSEATFRTGHVQERRLMQEEALGHIMKVRFLWSVKKKAAPGEGPPKARKLLK